jgi:3,4-dihydroxy-2-butanone 4-phosphate synthase
MRRDTEGVEVAIWDLKAGCRIVVVDDEDCENEGDLMMAGGIDHARAMNFIAARDTAQVCLAMPVVSRCTRAHRRASKGLPSRSRSTGFPGCVLCCPSTSR